MGMETDPDQENILGIGSRAGNESLEGHTRGTLRLNFQDNAR